VLLDITMTNYREALVALAARHRVHVTSNQYSRGRNQHPGNERGQTRE
jgi:hypothetical protein